MRLPPRYLHHPDHRAAVALVHTHELRESRSFRIDNVVAKKDCDRLVLINERERREHCVAVTERLRLSDECECGKPADPRDLLELAALAALCKPVLKFEIPIEVVLDRALPNRGDEDDLCDARSHGLFDDVLDDRLIDDGEHLLRLRLRRRQESRA